MKTSLQKMIVALVMILAGAMLPANANAECLSIGKSRATIRQQSWQGSGTFQAGSLLRISDSDDQSIVGMWHVIITAKGNADGPPDGTPLDNALAVWHSDKTEIMNSARPPQDGNFCMGVWEKTGRSTYKLNHFAWLGNDTANAPSGIGNPSGPTHLVQNVILSRDGNHYAGTFVVDVYDTSNNLVAHVIGVVTATRITVDTPESSLF
jgi:hypothetical protein